MKFLLTILGIFFFLGCGPETTGGDNVTKESAYCVETENVLDSVEVTSSLMEQSAEQLIASFNSPVSVDAQYSENEQVLTQSPMNGQTMLTLEIVYNSGQIREIESSVHQGAIEKDINCQPRLEVDVEVVVTTDDQSFDETWPGVLLHERGGNPELIAEFDPETSFQGTFEIVQYNNPASPVTLTGQLHNVVNDDVNIGSIEIVAEHEDDNESDAPKGRTKHVALSW